MKSTLSAILICLSVVTATRLTAASSLSAPTIQADHIVVTQITSTSATITWTNGDGENRVVFIESPSDIAAAPTDKTTYIASDDWNNKGSQLPSSNYYCVYKGSGNSVTLKNLTPKSRYTIRISEFNGQAGEELYLTSISDENPVVFYTQPMVKAPTVQASDIIVTQITSSSATITWVNGNGTNRVVFIENPSQIAAAPYDNTTYTASNDWNVKGTRIGTSNYYCVYNGSENSVTVRNLTPGATYAVRISEYNGTAGDEKYLTSIFGNNPMSFTTLDLSTPTIQASQIALSNVSSSSATISWVNGDGENRVVFLEYPSETDAAPYDNTTYSANSNWKLKGTQIGTSNYYCIYNGSGNQVTVTNLIPNAQYKIRISEYNGPVNNEKYLTEIAAGNPQTFQTSALSIPTVQTNHIVVSDITSSTATISWTNGDGEHRVVFVESPTGIAAAPYDNITYQASTDWNSKGTRIETSNYYCVYNGQGNSVKIKNLTPDERYTVRISEYNGPAGSELYLTTLSSENPVTFYTLAPVERPTIQASQIEVSNLTATTATISWTNGNGENRVVFAENPSQIAAAPYDHTSYAASPDWSIKGTRIGNSNYYCAYNGSGNSITLTNLTPNSDYAIRISEYNGLPSDEKYLTTIVNQNPISFTTLEPTSTEVNEGGVQNPMITIMPGSSDGMIEIQSNHTNPHSMAVWVYQMNGQAIYQQTTLQTTLKIDLTKNKKGIYLVKVVSNGAATAKKIYLK